MKTVLKDEQIAAMRRDIFIVWRDEDHEAIQKLAREVEKAVLSSGIVQALKRDAERYRWLRETEQSEVKIFSPSYGSLSSDLSGNHLDVTIDSAMENSK